MEVPGSGESHYYVTHEDFESESILTICSPLHPLRGSFPRRGTRENQRPLAAKRKNPPLIGGMPKAGGKMYG